jgi:hypothetical protein
MLCPLSWNHQPFRFVALEEGDQRRMRVAFQSGMYRNIAEEEWIEEFRAAIVNWNPAPRRHFLRAVVLAAVTVATICLGIVIYVFSAHLR